VVDGIGEKWKRMARELFAVFSKAMEENGYTVKEVIHPVFHPKNIQDMCRDMGKSDIEDMIIFSVKNWEKLKDVRGLRGLSNEPCFNQMLSQFKYPTLVYAMRAGIEAVRPDIASEEKKEDELPKESLFKKWNTPRTP
jgi:hypothetical protein